MLAAACLLFICTPLRYSNISCFRSIAFRYFRFFTRIEVEHLQSYDDHTGTAVYSVSVFIAVIAFITIIIGRLTLRIALLVRVFVRIRADRISTRTTARTGTVVVLHCVTFQLVLIRAGVLVSYK
eukprot:scaffold211797_cov18-Prasinocladus_malaysianus.AAC.1